jgi:MFS family permease
MANFEQGVGGFALAAPLLGVINDDIGPDPNYVWIALVYTLTLAIGLVLVGRLSDSIWQEMVLHLRLGPCTSRLHC